MDTEELVGLSRGERIAYAQKRFQDFRAKMNSKRPRYPQELQRLACGLVMNDEMGPWKAAQYIGVSHVTVQAWISSHAPPEVREIRLVSETKHLPGADSADGSSPTRSVVAIEQSSSSSSVVLEMKNGARLILAGNYAERALAHILNEVMKNA
jgi:hypothetical protein